MAVAVSCCQVVDGRGEYEKDAVEQFFNGVKIEHAGRDYQVVAIMGPQSSGKSTLLNTVFGTSFVEMNAMAGRQQTTKGIWLAESPKIDAPTTLVMDLEGNDGRERGEDDTSFERQTALFALAVADCVLINMWAKDIGRETGAGKPLLKTIFQVNLKLFTPAPNKRKTVLLFVFRDRTKTPLEKLVETWEADLERMWLAITKPPQYEALAVTDFFEVKYAALSNFEEREEDFRAEAVMLRRRFTDEEADDSLVRTSDDKIPGNAVPLSMEKVWEVVKANKDLNLPAHKVMVANIRCEEIAVEQLAALRRDALFDALQQQADSGVLPDFGERAGGLINSCLTGYDEEAAYFEAGVCAGKRAELVEGVRVLMSPLWQQQQRHLRAVTVSAFDAALRAGMEEGLGFADAAARAKESALVQFDDVLAGIVPTALEWDEGTAREAAVAQLDAAVEEARQQEVSRLLSASTATLASSLTVPTSALLDAPPPDLWPRLQRLYSKGAVNAYEHVAAGLEGYGVPESQMQQLREQIDAAAAAKLESHMREAANTALSRLRDRFNDAFQRGEDGLPRTWGPRANVPAAAAAARVAAARVLAQLAVMRHRGTDGSSVDAAVLAMADTAESSSSAAVSSDTDMLSLVEWPRVPEADVLLSPPTCRQLWRQLVSDSNLVVQQALATQEANRAASSRLPPLWALAAIVVLGFNEAMALLYNPLYLLLVAFLFFFGRTVYNELDVDTEMSRGLLPGVLAVSAKLVPTVRSVTGRTLESAKQFLADAAHPSAEYAHKKVDAADGSDESISSTAPRASNVEMTGLRKRAPVPVLE